MSINARESAPDGAHRNMFNDADEGKNSSYYGLESLAVPGELAGYRYVFERYGSRNIKWEDLFEQAIQYAKDGFIVGEKLARAINQNRDIIYHHKHLSDVFVNPNTGKVFTTGETLKQPALGNTLEELSKSSDPMMTFYTIQAKKIIDDIEKLKKSFPDQKPIITVRDFQKYDVIESKKYGYPVKFKNENYLLHTSDLPSSGILIQFMLRILSKYDDLYPQAYMDQTKSELFYQRLIETFKFAFANRQFLGDDNYDDNIKPYFERLKSENYITEVFRKIKDDTTFNAKESNYYERMYYQKFDSDIAAHTSILDRQGNAVAITSSINNL